ncbi:MAG: DUF2807 domain-containing protein [Dysgonamonadaceae bacterium]|jgi:hypothetical protein|nr:DUF2807 domain-containing protein [Dysgonamonadaceae bacterium]
MKRFTILFAWCLVTLPLFQACTLNFGKSIKGNHQIVNTEIAIGDYDEIALSLPAEVVYRQISQDEPFLQVSTDENLLQSLDIFVRGNQLVLKRQEEVNLHPSRLVIYTNSRSLSKVSIAGSGDVHLENAVNARNLEVSIAGSGDFKTDSLYCETLDLKIAGSGDVELKGAATNAQYTIAGSGDIKAFDYLVENLDCRINGSGDIRAYVDKKLNAKISGSGDIRYKGTPASVNQKVNGSGSISQAE